MEQYENLNVGEQGQKYNSLCGMQTELLFL